MIIIRHNGHTVVLKGWRAWLAGAAALVISWLLLAVFVFVVIGVTITIGVVLLLLIPALFVVAALARILGSRRT